MQLNYPGQITELFPISYSNDVTLGTLGVVLHYFTVTGQRNSKYK